MTANAAADAARINALRGWFIDSGHYEWVIQQFGYSMAEMEASGYKLAIEPIAYFRYQGFNYAMTATEAALFDQLANGALSSAMAPLTRKNLPLAIFLEHDEFTESLFRINRWTGTTNSNVPNSDIINQLGIGYISYSGNPPVTEAAADFSYPTDTWVVTAFRLCNVRRSNGSWVPGEAYTYFNPASARATINGTIYNIRNVHIPRGGEQVIWVKWRTPSTPGMITATVNTSTGFLYNTRNTGASDRYVNTINARISIYSNNMENPPPDPTLNDTAASIGYTASSAASGMNNHMRGNSGNMNSWTVWDCGWTRISSSIRTYDWWDSPWDYYDPETGIYTEHEFIRANHDYTRYTYRAVRYRIQFNRIFYTAEVRNSYVRITPDVNCPTAYTQHNRTFMKSGYGINVEVEPFIRVTMRHERTGATTTTNYFAPVTTNFVAAPQHLFAYFPEFGYVRFNRQLESVNNRFAFRQNQFSTFNERTHYTPWWFPDNANYEIVVRSDFAYTPSGRLRVNQVSDAITIDGVLFDDWRVAPSF